MADFNQGLSMGDILASITRAIAEDERAAFASSRRGTVERSRTWPQPGPVAEDVLELSNPVLDEDRLISEGSTAASRQSLALLAAVRQQNGSSVSSEHVHTGPLEAVVRDMLRPMLKDRLDERLPEIVEEMVAREIARITGKSP